jgi:hypothetical protein
MSASMAVNGMAAATAGSPQVNDKDASITQLCAKLGITDLRDTALDLARRHLKPEQVRLEAATDPEGTSEWLVIRAEVRGAVDDVLEKYAACKREWIALAPPSQRGLVRFLYDII